MVHANGGMALLVRLLDRAVGPKVREFAALAIVNACRLVLAAHADACVPASLYVFSSTFSLSTGRPLSTLSSFCIQIFTSAQFLHSNIHVCPVFAFKYSRLSSFCIQIFTFALARTGTHTPTPNSGKQQSGYAASEWQADAAAKLAALCDDASATENAKKYASGALKLVAASIGKAPLVNKGLI